LLISYYGFEEADRGRPNGDRQALGSQIHSEGALIDASLDSNRQQRKEIDDLWKA
jgi:hypothetical protein